MRSVEEAAAREHVDLITVNNRYSAREAVRNADLLIKERVDLVLEYQTHELVAPVIASKFLEANTPVIAIEVPHPGAAYFGANNYKAGLIGGKALGRWARERWQGKADQIIMLELPIAGSLLELQIIGLMDGLRAELPLAVSIPVARLDGSGDVEQVLEVICKYPQHAVPSSAASTTSVPLLLSAPLETWVPASVARSSARTPSESRAMSCAAPARASSAPSPTSRSATATNSLPWRSECCGRSLYRPLSSSSTGSSRRATSTFSIRWTAAPISMSILPWLHAPILAPSPMRAKLQSICHERGGARHAVEAAVARR
jgi:hypothetical protein